MEAQHRGKPALLGYVQNGGTVPQNPKLHAQVPLKFEPGDDGVTFHLGTTFLDTVPPGRPAKWSGQPQGSHIAPPPADGPPIKIRQITGPITQLSADTFRLDLNRTSLATTAAGTTRG